MTQGARPGRRRQAPLWLLCCALCFAAQGAPAWALETGDPFPGLSGQRLGDGTPLSTADFRGGPVYVDVWASWCPPCRLALPVLQTLHRRYAGQGFAVVGANVDSSAVAATQAMQRAGADYPVIHGLAEAQLRLLDMQAMPSGYLLDAAGRVRLVHEGFRREDEATLDRAIRTLLEDAR